MTDTLLINGHYWTVAELAALTKPLYVFNHLNLGNWRHPLPMLTSIGGNAYLRGYQHDLPSLTTIGGNAFLWHYQHSLPSLTAIGGWAYLENYQHSLPALITIGGAAILKGYHHDLLALTAIGGGINLENFYGALPAWLIDGGADSRGFYFTGMLVGDTWRIRTGCHNFTLTEARAHWGSGGASDRPDCLALVEKIAAEITRRKNLSL